MTEMREMYAICHPGDLDGPDPFLYFEDRAVAEAVCAAMNAEEEWEDDRYTLRVIATWPGSEMPVRTAHFELQGWIDRDSGAFLSDYPGLDPEVPGPAPEVVESRLWPWSLPYYAVSVGAAARPVPIGIYLRSSGFERGPVEAEFARLLAAERRAITRRRRAATRKARMAEADARL